MGFLAIDWILFSLSLLAVVIVGMYFAYKDKGQTTSDVLLGNRQMSVVPVALTLFASFVSAITIMGYPADVYENGTMIYYFVIPFAISVIISVFLYIPVYHSLQLTSVYEYLEMRFNSTVRIIASATFILQTSLYLAVVLYAPALVIATVTGLPVIWSIILTGLIAAFYTTIGGANAVVWTSSLQTLLIIAGIIAVIIAGVVDQGNLAEIVEKNREGGRLIFDDFRFDRRVRHSFWALTIGGVFTLLPLFATSQLSVQRYLSLPTLTKAKITAFLCIVIQSIFMLIVLTCGLVLFATYFGCDPRDSGKIARADEMLLFYVTDQLKHIYGLPGLFTAAIYGGGLSTLSGGFNALSAAVYVDFVKKIWITLNAAHSEAYKARVTKLISFYFGAQTIGLAILINYTKRNVIQMALSIFGMVGGPLLGVFTMGIFNPFCSSKGAIVGQLTSLTFNLWLGLGAVVCKVGTPPLPRFSYECNSTSTEPLSLNTTFSSRPEVTSDDACGGVRFFHEISYQYYGLIGLAVFSLSATITSLLTGGSANNFDRKLFSTIVGRWLPEEQLVELKIADEQQNMLNHDEHDHKPD